MKSLLILNTLLITVSLGAVPPKKIYTCPWRQVDGHSDLLLYLLHDVSQDCDNTFSKEELEQHITSHLKAIGQASRTLLAITYLLECTDDRTFPLKTKVFDQISRDLTQHLHRCPFSNCAKSFTASPGLLEHMEHDHCYPIKQIKRRQRTYEYDASLPPPHKLRRRSTRLAQKKS